MAVYSCSECSYNFSTCSSYNRHLTKHQILPDISDEFLTLMLKEEALLDPCPSHLVDNYKIQVKNGYVKTAQDIEEEERRVVNNFIRDLIKDDETNPRIACNDNKTESKVDKKMSQNYKISTKTEPLYSNRKDFNILNNVKTEPSIKEEVFSDNEEEKLTTKDGDKIINGKFERTPSISEKAQTVNKNAFKPCLTGNDSNISLPLTNKLEKKNSDDVTKNLHDAALRKMSTKGTPEVPELTQMKQTSRSSNTNKISSPLMMKNLTELGSREKISEKTPEETLKQKNSVSPLVKLPDGSLWERISGQSQLKKRIEEHPNVAQSENGLNNVLNESLTKVGDKKVEKLHRKPEIQSTDQISSLIKSNLETENKIGPGPKFDQERTALLKKLAIKESIKDSIKKLDSSPATTDKILSPQIEISKYALGNKTPAKHTTVGGTRNNIPGPTVNSTGVLSREKLSKDILAPKTPGKATGYEVNGKSSDINKVYLPVKTNIVKPKVINTNVKNEKLGQKYDSPTRKMTKNYLDNDGMDEEYDVMDVLKKYRPIVAQWSPGENEEVELNSETFFGDEMEKEREFKFDIQSKEKKIQVPEKNRIETLKQMTNVSKVNKTYYEKSYKPKVKDTVPDQLEIRSGNEAMGQDETSSDNSFSYLDILNKYKKSTNTDVESTKQKSSTVQDAVPESLNEYSDGEDDYMKILGRYNC